MHACSIWSPDSSPGSFSPSFKHASTWIPSERQANSSRQLLSAYNCSWSARLIPAARKYAECFSCSVIRPLAIHNYAKVVPCWDACKLQPTPIQCCMISILVQDFRSRTRSPRCNNQCSVTGDGVELFLTFLLRGINRHCCELCEKKYSSEFLPQSAQKL